MGTGLEARGAVAMDGVAPTDEGARERLRSWGEAAQVELGLAPRQVALVVALPALLIVPVVVAAAVSADVYKVLIAEDGPFEWGQVGLFAGAAVLAAVIARGHASAGRRPLAVVFAMAVVGMVFIAGEEVSWGQRVFDLETPAELAELNRQDEITLHNIHGVEDVFRLTVLGVGLWGTVAPFTLRRPRWRAHAPHVVAALVPHPVFAPAFATIAGWRLYRTLFPTPADYAFVVGEFAEVTELLLAMVVVLFLGLQVRAGWHRAP